MINETRTSKQSQETLSDAGKPESETIDKERRAALLNIGALAGAAPAVAVLLSPSIARATSSGGSPCEEPCGTGRGPAPGYTPGDTGAPGDVGFLGKRES